MSVCFFLSPDALLCSSGCRCPDEAFNPVCGSDGIEFRSPCHAGCKKMKLDANLKVTVSIVIFIR